MGYFLDENFDAIQKLIDDEKAEKYSKDEFNEQLEKDIKEDLNTLRKIQNFWKEIDFDPKLESFLNKLKSDKVLTKNKLIIFTESKETAKYLQEKLYHFWTI
jgi:ERCC4-related helicase